MKGTRGPPFHGTNCIGNLPHRPNTPIARLWSLSGLAAAQDCFCFLFILCELGGIATTAKSEPLQYRQSANRDRRYVVSLGSTTRIRCGNKLSAATSQVLSPLIGFPQHAIEPTARGLWFFSLKVQAETRGSACGPETVCGIQGGVEAPDARSVQWKRHTLPPLNSTQPINFAA